MKKNVTLLIFLLLAHKIIFCQEYINTVVGYVVIVNSNKKPGFPVQIRCETSISETTSSGYFELKLYNKKPGTDIQIEVIKPGYEVINHDQLLTRVPIDASHQVQIHIEIEKVGLSKSKSLRYLNEFLSHFPKSKLTSKVHTQAKTIADYFSTTNFDYAPVEMGKALQSFKAGSLLQASNLLDEDKLIANIQNANKSEIIGDSLINIGKQTKEQGSLRKTNNIDALLLKASILDASSDFIRESRLLEKIYNLDSENARTVFMVAKGFESIPNYTKAILFLNKVLTLSIDSINRANTYSDLGNIYATRKEFSFAKQCFLNAKVILENKREPFQEIYYRLLNCYNSLANIYSYGSEKNIDSAKYLYFLIIHNRLKGHITPKELFETIRRAYLNIGILYVDEKKYDSARISFNAALFKPRDFSDSLEIAFVYLKFADLYSDLNDFLKAESFGEKALIIYEAKQNNLSNDSKLHLAFLYMSMAEINKNLKKHLEVEKYAKKYNSTILLLFQQDSLSFISEEINSLQYCGKISYEHKNYQQALEYYKEALLYLSKDISKTIQTTEYDLINIKIEIGDTYYNLQKSNDALSSYNAAQNEILLKNDQDKYSFDLGRINLGKGLIFEDINDIDSAFNSYHVAADYFKSSKNAPISIAEINRATALNNFGRLELQNGSPFLAILTLQEALEIYEKYNTSFNSSLIFKISNTLYNLGQAHFELGHSDLAIKYFKNQINLTEDLSFYSKELYEMDYFKAILNLGGIYNSIKQLDSAKFYLNKSLELCKCKSPNNSSQAKYFLETAYSLSETFFFEGNLIEFEQIYTTLKKVNNQFPNILTEDDLFRVNERLNILRQNKKNGKD